MTERQFFIVFAICVLLAEAALLAVLRMSGADEETQASVFALFVGAAGLSGGLLLLRYR
jgi:hypothetical protein